jgi:hypothetical protein
MIFAERRRREYSMRNKTRLISKSKSYGFNPWVDQVDAINQIMKETGERTESVLLRKLVDEALEARRKKRLSVPLTEQSDLETGERLQTIENLLMRLVRQGDTSLRIQDVCLALQQDVLAEAHAALRVSWESLVMPQLREKGIDGNESEQRFMLQMDRAKDYAYGLAERIKQSQEAPE